MSFIYLGIGSNKGNKLSNIKEALKYLKEKIQITRVSSLYLTEPVDIEGEWFINCVLEAKTEKQPLKVLKELLKIEKIMGRIRTKQKRPRIIDLDFLLYGNKIIEEEGLILPHPRLHTRRFVLIPLWEINPHLFHPVLKKSINEILKNLKDTHRVIRIPNGYS